MKIFFLDTSAFVKYYHEEVGSEKIKRIYSEKQRGLVISDIMILKDSTRGINREVLN